MGCKIEDCDGIGKLTKGKRHLVKGYCNMHYERVYRYGNPHFVKHVQNEGRKYHPLYNTYKGLFSRCYNPKNKNYHRYGGRGITVCDRWSAQDGFWRFVKDMGERPEGTSLDRIDNSKGYSPDNCRWATYKMQNNNTKWTEIAKGYTFRNNKYRALGTFHGKVIHLGTYNTAEEAHNAYINAKKEYFKEIYNG